MKDQRLLVIGGGMAAGRLLQRLVEQGYPGRISLVCSEPVPVYNRVLLPGLLTGDCTRESLLSQADDWYVANGISVLRGVAAERIDTATRQVMLVDGRCIGYDRLVLATGSTVPLPEIPGIGLPGVTVFRSLADADSLKAQSAHGAPVVIVGGGLLGLETAHSLVQAGVPVRVVQRGARLLNRQLDAPAADILRRVLESRGITFRLGAQAVRVLGVDKVTGVELDSGERLAAGCVVFATGTTPNDALAVEAGLRCSRGVVVDDGLRSSHAHVYAVGECARVGGQSYSLVEPVYRQADALAATLMGGHACFVPPPPATRLKVSGIELFSAGEVDAPAGVDEVLIRDQGRGLYRRLLFRGERLVGAVLLGDAVGGRRVQELIDTQAVIAGTRDPIAFGFELQEQIA